MNAIEKIVLGTVQFGLNYGINNQTGQVSPKEILNILTLARKAGVKMLDTSSAYGESEAALGNVFNQNPLDFSIVTKYPKGASTVPAAFNASLSRLEQKSVYGYLMHHFDHFQAHSDLWNDFEELKNQGLVSKIGFSLYHPEQLCELMDRGISFDLIQIPYNIFDRQFEPYLKLMHQSGVEIHTRSVFLQGLFFKDLNSLGETLAPLRPYLHEMHVHCTQKKQSVEQLALNFVANNPYIDGILIGVDSVAQLQGNIQALSHGLDDEDVDFLQSIQVKETHLLNPVNW